MWSSYNSFSCLLHPSSQYNYITNLELMQLLVVYIIIMIIWYIIIMLTLPGFPWWLSDKESICQSRRHEFDPWVRKIPWRRKWQPTLVPLPGNPVDRGAWQTIVHGVTKSWTWLRLNSSNNKHCWAKWYFMGMFPFRSLLLFFTIVND